MTGRWLNPSEGALGKIGNSVEADEVDPGVEFFQYDVVVLDGLRLVLDGGGVVEGFEGDLEVGVDLVGLLGGGVVVDGGVELEHGVANVVHLEADAGLDVGPGAALDGLDGGEEASLGLVDDLLEGEQLGVVVRLVLHRAACLDARRVRRRRAAHAEDRDLRRVPALRQRRARTSQQRRRCTPQRRAPRNTHRGRASACRRALRLRQTCARERGCGCECGVHVGRSSTVRGRANVCNQLWFVGFDTLAQYKSNLNLPRATTEIS